MSHSPEMRLMASSTSLKIVRIAFYTVKQLNVVTGFHARDKVNVDISINIGQEQMAAFEYGWPTRFNIIPTKNVTLITSTKKSIKLDGKAVYYTELMYTRVICL